MVKKNTKTQVTKSSNKSTQVVNKKNPPAAPSVAKSPLPKTTSSKAELIKSKTEPSKSAPIAAKNDKELKAKQLPLKKKEQGPVSTKTTTKIASQGSVKKNANQQENQILASSVKETNKNLLTTVRALDVFDNDKDIGSRQLNLNHPYSVTSKAALKDSKREKEDDFQLKSYKISTKFTVGDRLVHQDFGKGLVRDIIGEHKIRVSFKDFEKILVHGVN